jgi:hypothetical protein
MASQDIGFALPLGDQLRTDGSGKIIRTDGSSKIRRHPLPLPFLIV